MSILHQLLRRARLHVDAIAHPAMGMHVPGSTWIRLEFPAQVVHIDMKVVDRVFIPPSPDLLEDLSVHHHSPCILKEAGK
jgi:hypothetical protein